jgi:hypothetical protein
MSKITNDDFAYINNPDVFEAEANKAFDEANEYLYGDSYNGFSWKDNNHSAYHVFSNYSYDILGHVDIVPEAIKWVQLYARRFFNTDSRHEPTRYL